MKQYAFFIDRKDAGKRLTEKLNFLNNQRLVIYSILNGGIPIGYEIATRFSCPLDFVLVRKLHYPGQPEIGFGAISIDGTIELNYEAIRDLNLSEKETQLIIDDSIAQLKTKKEKIGCQQMSFNLFFKTALIVDDGLASGYTMHVAIRMLKKSNPKRIIVAVPTASRRGIELIKNDADEIICLYEHPTHYPFKIKDSYQRWHEISDEETKTILKTLKSNSMTFRIRIMSIMNIMYHRIPPTFTKIPASNRHTRHNKQKYKTKNQSFSN